eukprot:625043-Amphidinium_carterae.1
MLSSLTCVRACDCRQKEGARINASLAALKVRMPLHLQVFFLHIASSDEQECVRASAGGSKFISYRLGCDAKRDCQKKSHTLGNHSVVAAESCANFSCKAHTHCHS